MGLHNKYNKWENEIKQLNNKLGTNLKRIRNTENNFEICLETFKTVFKIFHSWLALALAEPFP